MSYAAALCCCRRYASSASSTTAANDRRSRLAASSTAALSSGVVRMWMMAFRTRLGAVVFLPVATVSHSVVDVLPLVPIMGPTASKINTPKAERPMDRNRETDGPNLGGSFALLASVRASCQPTKRERAPEARATKFGGLI